ncbi:hypothetical protein ACOME3_002653 [Neoechinorhynchus agilis]
MLSSADVDKISEDVYSCKMDNYRNFDELITTIYEYYSLLKKLFMMCDPKWLKDFAMVVKNQLDFCYRWYETFLADFIQRLDKSEETIDRLSVAIRYIPNFDRFCIAYNKYALNQFMTNDENGLLERRGSFKDYGEEVTEHEIKLVHALSILREADHKWKEHADSIDEDGVITEFFPIPEFLNFGNQSIDEMPMDAIQQLSKFRQCTSYDPDVQLCYSPEQSRFHCSMFSKNAALMILNGYQLKVLQCFPLGSETYLTTMNVVSTTGINEEVVQRALATLELFKVIHRTKNGYVLNELTAPTYTMDLASMWDFVKVEKVDESLVPGLPNQELTRQENTDAIDAAIVRTCKKAKVVQENVLFGIVGSQLENYFDLTEMSFSERLDIMIEQGFLQRDIELNGVSYIP